MLEAHSPRRSLTRLVALFGVALPPLLVVSGIALDHARREARSQDLADTRVVAERLAGELNRILDVPAAQLRLAAAQAPVQQLLAQPLGSGPMATATRALAQARALDPEMAGEMCLLDVKGIERARLIGRRALSAKALATSPSQAAWFSPSLAVRVGGVHRHTAYVSPDSRIWVTSTSAPVAAAGAIVGVIHVETPLEAVRTRWAAAIPAGIRARVIDPATGTVMLDATTTPEPSSNLDLTTQWLPRERPITGDAGRDADRVKSAVTVNAWRVDVLSANEPGFPLGTALMLAGIVVATGAGLLWLGLRTSTRTSPAPDRAIAATEPLGTAPIEAEPIEAESLDGEPIEAEPIEASGRLPMPSTAAARVPAQSAPVEQTVIEDDEATSEPAPASVASAAPESSGEAADDDQDDEQHTEQAELDTEAETAAGARV